MANPMGQIGYDQTAITNVQASVVTPESNAITESPATTSQTIKESSAKTCEATSQNKMGLRETGVVSKAVLL